MHDIRAIRNNPHILRAGLHRRGADTAVVDRLLELDTDKRAAEAALQACEERRNALSRLIPEAARARDPALTILKDEAVELKTRLPTFQEKAARTADTLRNVLLSIPNHPAPDVPDGKDETFNVVTAVAGEPVTEAWHVPHWEYAARFGMDFEAGAMLGGSRFTVLRKNMARLSRALGQFMLNEIIRLQRAEEVNAPFIVLPGIMEGTGQLPKFEDDLFHADAGYLIPTGEVTLTNLVRERAVDMSTGPLRMATLSHCFRKEVGGAGRDVRGYIRQHQFEKVEMVTVCRPEEADTEQLRMLDTARYVLDALGLVHRTVLLCTGDTGFSAARTYDLEVWMPGTRTWREISSISTCGDFQTRRMGTRMEGGGYPHTLNGSGVAVGRALVAVLENGLTEDGRIFLPAPLAFAMDMSFMHPQF